MSCIVSPFLWETSLEHATQCAKQSPACVQVCSTLRACASDFQAMFQFDILNIGSVPENCPFLHAQMQEPLCTLDHTLEHVLWAIIQVSILQIIILALKPMVWDCFADRHFKNPQYVQSHLQKKCHKERWTPMVEAVEGSGCGLERKAWDSPTMGQAAQQSTMALPNLLHLIHSI